MKGKIQQLVKQFKMNEHPEGGWYFETHRSKNSVSVPQDVYGEEKRTALTSIYFLLTGENFSAWHKVKSDEIWYFHSGSPLTIMTLDKDGELKQQVLGDFLQAPENVYQITVPADTWFCAFVNDKNSYTFVGCAVGPGFEFPDFTLADRKELGERFPKHKAVINQYIR